MKFYKRMIRPMITPVLQGFNCSPKPLISEDYWCDDTYEFTLKKVWEKEIKDRDTWNSLIIDEKYVEVELPTLETKNVGVNDTICITFDINQIDIDTVSEYLQQLDKIYPKETPLVMLPNCMCFEVLDKEAVYHFIDRYKKIVDKKYGKK